MSFTSIHLEDISPETYLTGAAVFPLLGWPFYSDGLNPAVVLIITNFPLMIIYPFHWLCSLNDPNISSPSLWFILIPVFGLALCIARGETRPVDRAKPLEEPLDEEPHAVGTLVFWAILLRCTSMVFRAYNHSLPIMALNNITTLLTCSLGFPLVDMLFRDSFLDYLFVPLVARNGPFWERLRSERIPGIGNMTWGEAVATWALIMYFWVVMGWFWSMYRVFNGFTT